VRDIRKNHNFRKHEANQDIETNAANQDSQPEDDVLREEHLVPLGMSANSLAKALNVTPARINDIVRERRRITADTALRLARYFGTDARSWINLQAAYDLRIAELAQAKRITSTIRPRAA
jgi:addiction module HigA family antidote